MLFENDLRLLEQFGAGHEGPVAWLRFVLRPRHCGAQEIADALTMAGDKLERLTASGVGDAAGSSSAGC